jgi:glyoxylase-like metal-dependent hydrolase (beta-lactamase superfamily II)
MRPPLLNALRLTAAFAIAACTLAAAPARAQAPIDFSKVEVKVTDLGHQTYMLAGAGGNVTIAVGTDGIIMVDGQYAPMHDKLKAAIAKISPLPIKYLINTHFHGDHTGGNAPFHRDGATIVAQDNIRVRLAAGTTNGLSGAKTPPQPADALPTDTYFGGQKIIEVGGRRAILTHINNAHTDGDTYVWFADANVLCTGDVFNNRKKYQTIDYANGGSIEGMAQANETFLTFIDDNTKVIPGHGGLAHKADVVGFHNMLTTARDRIKKLYLEGKTEAEVIAMKPLADLDATWADNEKAAADYTKMVYNSFRRS